MIHQNLVLPRHMIQKSEQSSKKALESNSRYTKLSLQETSIKFWQLDAQVQLRHLCVQGLRIAVKLHQTSIPKMDLFKAALLNHRFPSKMLSNFGASWRPNQAPGARRGNSSPPGPSCHPKPLPQNVTRHGRTMAKETNKRNKNMKNIEKHEMPSEKPRTCSGSLGTQQDHPVYWEW